MKFLHVSDLHLFQDENSSNVTEDVFHIDLKKMALSEIATAVERHSIDAIFVSGDIECNHPDDLMPVIRRWSETGATIFAVYGDHDTPPVRRNLNREFSRVPGCHVIDKPRSVEVADLSIRVVGMSCRSKQEGFRDQFSKLHFVSDDVPTVFLSHPYDLPARDLNMSQVRYYALGHLHRPLIQNLPSGAIKARPGHLYSWWDGDGSAWPTGYILGSLSGAKVKAKFVPFSKKIPQTRRFYVDPFIRENRSMKVCLENCPEDEGRALVRGWGGHWRDDGFRGVYSNFLLRTEVPGIISDILRMFDEDIFVTPSDGVNMRRKYGTSRVAMRGATIVNHEKVRTEYLERSFKARANTQ